MWAVWNEGPLEVSGGEYLVQAVGNCAWGICGHNTYVSFLVDLSGNTCAPCCMLAMKMEAACSSETSVSTYRSAVSQPRSPQSG